MNPPRVTVLMTAYNAGSFLDDSIRSVIYQTFRDFEFLIVDDASTDGTAERLVAWEQKDSRIRLVRCQTNRGQTVCLNQGLAEARGEWIARQDADDVSAPTRLEKQMARIGEDPELVLLGANGWIMNAEGKPNGTLNVPLSDPAIRWAMPIQNPLIHTAVLFRRGLCYDETFQICQDWELWARLIQTGKVANLPDRLVFYRHHESSLSHARADRTAEECRRLTERAEVDGVWLEKFRRGLRPEERSEFWRRYRSWLSQSPHRSGAREAIAIHRIQAAGSLWGQSRLAGLAELLAAFRADPESFFRFLRDRLSLPATGRFTKTGDRSSAPS